MIQYKIDGLKIEALIRKEGYSDVYLDKCLGKYYCYMALLIYASLINSREYKRGYVRIYTRKIREIFGQIRVNGKSKRVFYLAKNDFKKWGVTLHKLYLIGANKGRSDFKIKDEWFNKPFSILTKNDANIELIKSINTCLDEYSFFRLEDLRESMTMNYEKELLPLYQKLEDNYKLILLDTSQAKNLMNNYLEERHQFEPKRNWKKQIYTPIYDDAKHRAWTMLADNFVANKYFSVCERGRVYNSLTNLPRDLRQYLSVNEDPFFEIDIANCQPMLIVPLLYQSLRDQGQEIPDDVLLYKRLTEKGIFYNYFLTCLDKHSVSYSEFKGVYKLDFFKRIFFDTEKINYKYKQVFNAIFPTVGRFIKNIKQDNYKQLSYLLQKLEAEIMVKGVAQSLLNSEINEFYVLHDAICAPMKHVNKVKQAILAEFKKVELSPVIKVKDFRGNLINMN